jgi:hypothetical protein
MFSLNWPSSKVPPQINSTLSIHGIKLIILGIQPYMNYMNGSERYKIQVKEVTNG